MTFSAFSWPFVLEFTVLFFVWFESVTFLSASWRLSASSAALSWSAFNSFYYASLTTYGAISDDTYAKFDCLRSWLSFMSCDRSLSREISEVWIFWRL